MYLLTIATKVYAFNLRKFVKTCFKFAHEIFFIYLLTIELLNMCVKNIDKQLDYCTLKSKEIPNHMNCLY